MGQKLSSYYEAAKAKGGGKAQMRMAILTLMPSSKASLEADSPENIKKFEAAMREIEKEFK